MSKLIDEIKKEVNSEITKNGKIGMCARAIVKVENSKLELMHLFNSIESNYFIIGASKIKKLSEDVDHTNSFVPDKVLKIKGKINLITDELDEIIKEIDTMLED